MEGGREREGGRETEGGREREGGRYMYIEGKREGGSECVGERGRERGREGVCVRYIHRFFFNFLVYLGTAVRLVRGDTLRL